MRQILYFCLISALLGQSSCVTYRRCQQKYPASRDTLKTILLRDSIVLRSAMVPVHIKGDLIRDSLKIFIPAKPFSSDTLRSETPLAIAMAWIENDFLMMKLIQKDTTILTKLDNAIKEAYYWRNEYEKLRIIIPPPPPERYIPKTYKVTFWIVMGEILMIILLITFRILKKKIPLTSLTGILKKIVRS